MIKTETSKYLFDIDIKVDSVVDAVDRLFAYAVSMGASDIHVDPAAHDVHVRLRIDGEMEYVGELPNTMREEIVARLKILSGARTDIHAIPQDGRFRTSINGRPYNIRVSFMPTYHGENFVARILSESVSVKDSFASLGFIPEHASLMSASLSKPDGLILVTGPTGSGKTTTLRVCLDQKAHESLSVMTLEDPIEYEVPGVRHVHIRESFGVTFPSALRSALRQDPDVIMVGEIRDEETARTAIQTALTGHLVLSTLHTVGAIETIVRLREMKVEKYLIAATLRLVVSQRLVRTICRECTDATSDCPKCRGTGYSGRSVVAEILEIDDEIRNLIARGADEKSIRACASSKGFRTMVEDAIEKIEWGVTTHAEIMRILNS